MLRASGRVVVVGLALALAAGCQRTEQDVAAAPPAAPAPEAPVLSGKWEVEGVTVEKASGKTRQISGTIILAEEAGRYTSTFDLDTVLPSADGPMHAEVIGEGEGTVSGQTLTGTARTQLVVSSTPNVDPGFAFVPRRVGTRIVSKTTATLLEDGSISIEIESDPAAGEKYAPTRTSLKGSYVAPAKIGEAR
jgi:hypothetical protein